MHRKIMPLNLAVFFKKMFKAFYEMRWNEGILDIY